MFIFTHIEKCAGTSFNNSLNLTFPFYVHVTKNNYGGNELRNDLTYKEFKSINKFWVKGIGGHSLRPYLPFLNQEKFFKITFLRNPIDRYMSQYNHDHERGFSKDIDFFINRKYTENFMVNKLAGENDFNLASKFLEKYNFVGNADEYLKSISLLSDKMNTDFYGDNQIRNNRNKNKNYLKYSDLNSNQQLLVQEKNDLDIKLYEKFILQNKEIKKYENYVFKKPSKLRNKITSKFNKYKKEKIKTIRSLGNN